MDVFFCCKWLFHIPGLAPPDGGHSAAEFWPTLDVAAFTLTAAFELLG